MSQQQRQWFDMIVKGLAVIALGILGFFAARIVNSVDVASDAVIKLEVQMNDVKEDIGDVKSDMRDIRIEVKQLSNNK